MAKPTRLPNLDEQALLEQLRVRLITGKVPFLSHAVQDEKGERQLVLGLVSPEQARALWAEHKQSFGAPLDKLRLEIQAMSEQAEPEDAPQS